MVIPSRGAEFELTWLSGSALVLVGVGTGILSGLIGVGGGVVVVPVLMLAFGTSDLVAKGTSLLMMIPTAKVTGRAYATRARSSSSPDSSHGSRSSVSISARSSASSHYLSS